MLINKMIVKTEPGTPEKPIGVKLVQPMISSFFTSQKNESLIKSQRKINVLQVANKNGNASRKKSISKCNKSPAVKKRPTRKCSELSQFPVATDIKCKVIDKVERNMDDNDSKLNIIQLGKSLSTMHNHESNKNEQELQNILSKDKNLSFENGYLTISIDDSDNEDNDPVIVNDSNTNTVSDLSPLKRTTDVDCETSPSKKQKKTIKQTDAILKAKQCLFTETKESSDKILEETLDKTNTKENEISSSLVDFDEDTCEFNLNDYNVPVEELEAYSPTILRSLLDSTSTPNKSTLDESNFKESPISTTKTNEDIEVNNLTEIKKEPVSVVVSIKKELYTENYNESDATDLDKTVICDTQSKVHASFVSQLCIKHEADSFVSTSTQTIAATPDFTINTTNQNDSKLKKEPTLLNDVTLEQLPVRNVLFNAWMDMQKNANLLALLGNRKYTLENLFSIEQMYQEICVRLFTRMTKWQRIEKFFSAINLELDKSDLAFTRLENLDFIHRDFEQSELLETILNKLTVKELRILVNHRHIKLNRPKKSELIIALERFTANQPSLGHQTTEERLRAEAAQLIGPCLRLDQSLRDSLFHLQLLQHYAIPDITSSYKFYTYMSDIDAGHVILPTYKVHLVSPFENIESFNRYAKAMQLFYEYMYQFERRTKTDALMTLAEQAFEHLIEICNKPVDVSPVHHRFTAEHIYAKILTLSAVHFTKQAHKVIDWLMFLCDYYRGTKRGEWYDRLAMHLLKDDDTILLAVDVIKEGLRNPDVDDDDKASLFTRAQRVIKHYGVQDFTGLYKNNPILMAVITKTVIKVTQNVSVFKGGRLAYELDGELFTVEEFALKYYSKEGFPKGVHCEGSLLMTLFVALFWDVIYVDLDNSHPFVSSLQYIPLDLYSKAFYLNRKDLIDARLKDIACDWRDTEFYDWLRSFYVKHGHKKSAHDMRLCGEVMLEAAACIGREKLGLMLTRLVKDLRQYRAGMPDLFVWDYNVKKCCFVEVKSHNDKLSMKQKQWLEFLHSNEVPVQVCSVQLSSE